MNYYKKV